MVDRLNKRALDILLEAIEKSSELNISTSKVGNSLIVDMGVKCRGSYSAGIYLAKITMSGLADVKITLSRLVNHSIPFIEVYTDYPIEACILSQLAGWRIKVGDYFAMGSGPARILARRPRRLFEYINYSEDSDEAVLVLEADKLPDEKVIEYISGEIGLKPDNIYIAVAPTNSIAGSTQVSARVVETAIYKLYNLGFNIKHISFGYGRCPIAPPVSDMLIMLGKTNDMLLYGGEVVLNVSYSDDDKLREYVLSTPSKASKDYGVLLSEKIRDIGIEFLYKVDPMLFSIASITVYNTKTGSIFKAGDLNYGLIEKALNIK